MKNDLKIAIVTKDRPEILKKTLENIKSRDLLSKTLVVDGSEERGSEKICEQFSVHYFRQESLGMTSARNEALDHCNSDFIVFIDDDVEVSEKWYKALKSTLRREDVGGATGKLENESMEMSSIANTVRNYLFGGKKNFGEVLDNGVINGDFFYDKKKEVDHMPGCNMAFDVSVLEECGGFEEEYDVGNSYREDTAASYNVGKKGKIIYNPEASLDHLKAEEGRYEYRRLFYNTYLTRYFLNKNNIVKGVKNKLDYFIITLIRHFYFLSRSLANLDRRYIYYLKGEIRGLRDFVIKDSEPKNYL